MSWVAPTTKTTGTLITAAIWNQDVVDNSLHLGNTHNHTDNVGAGGGGSVAGLTAASARVRASGAQTVNDSTETAVAFNTEDYDTDTIHDTVTNNERLICKTAGRYLIFAHLYWAANGQSSGSYRIIFRVNTATDIGIDIRQKSANALIGNELATVKDLAVNDYVRCIAYQTSGAANDTVVAGDASPLFGMTRLSA